MTRAMAPRPGRRVHVDTIELDLRGVSAGTAATAAPTLGVVQPVLVTNDRQKVGERELPPRRTRLFHGAEFRPQHRRFGSDGFRRCRLKERLLLGCRDETLALRREQGFLQQLDLLVRRLQRFVLRRDRRPLLGDNPPLLLDRRLLRDDLRFQTLHTFQEAAEVGG